LQVIALAQHVYPPELGVHHFSHGAGQLYFFGARRTFALVGCPENGLRTSMVSKSNISSHSDVPAIHASNHD
jgi:hypothetical protein